MFSAVVFVFLATIVILNLLLLTRLRSHESFEARFESRETGFESRLRDDFARIQQRQTEESRALREEVAASIQRFASQTEQRTESFRSAVMHQLSDSRDEAQKQLETIRGIVDQRLHSLQTDNAAKLEQMRQTVDEKLQTTLETRLGESFRLVSERLEQVHKGLGEMQNLASGVGDLKRVLSNVTTRGAWGEVQLENLLAQILAPEQY
jgi:DNA recombination protein RmuC